MIACIYIPYFASTVEENFDPNLKDCPVVIKASPRKLYGFSQCAAKLGVDAMMRPSQTKALSSDMRFIQAVPARYQRALDELLEKLSRFSSHIDTIHLFATKKVRPEPLHSVFCYVELGDLQQQHTIQMAQSIGRMLKSETSFVASIGVASGKYVARVASTDSTTGAIRYVAPGTEQAYLAHHSIRTLPAQKETLRQLGLLGLRTLGQVASVSASAMFDQFGREGRLLRLLALGEDSTPVMQFTPKRYLRRYHQFDSPVENSFTLQAQFAAIAEEVGGLLKLDGSAGQCLNLILQQDDKKLLDSTVTLRQPSCDARRIYSTLLEMLSKLKVQTGIVEFGIEITDITGIQPQQLELFPSAASKELQFEQAVSNLVRRYGVDRFYEAKMANQMSSLPERRFELHEVSA